MINIQVKLYCYNITYNQESFLSCQQILHVTYRCVLKYMHSLHNIIMINIPVKLYCCNITYNQERLSSCQQILHVTYRRVLKYMHYYIC